MSTQTLAPPELEQAARDDDLIHIVCCRHLHENTPVALCGSQAHGPYLDVLGAGDPVCVVCDDLEASVPLGVCPTTGGRCG